MSSASIFRSLRELFPQVDLRMLRAISIEHEEDVNEAIEFILSEVLPASNTTPGVSFILHDTGNSEQDLRESDNGPEHITIPDGNRDSSFSSQNYIDGAENRGLDSFVAHGTEGCILGQPYFMSDADSGIEPEHEEPIYNNSLSFNLNQLSEKEDENFLYESHNQDGIVESLLHGGREEIIPTELFIKFTEELESVHMDLHSDTEELVQLRDEENISVQLDEHTISSAVLDECKNPMEYGFEQQNDIHIQLNACNDLSECSSEQCRPLNLHDSETVVTPTILTRLLSASDFSEKDQHYWSPTTETGKNAMDFDDHNSLSLDVKFLEFSSDENILPVTLATRSGHAVSTDVLEDSIKEAKSCKESLVSSFESMVSMMREVELFEENAELAKEEALVAGHHALCKVEELQQIVKKSKDENDMQSGQVYGERSILSTEARELQSRLLRMSQERSKYLSVIEEISKALEARKSAARDVIAAADLEKREKEEIALKTLKEIEVTRDAVAAESQKLDQEAEENSKLTEFLMDRGHVVDALQGEIAIVCEDILSLKQRVECRIPLAKSLMSSSSSSFTKPPLLLSSSSTSGSSVKSSEHSKRETSLLSSQEEENATVFINKPEARETPLLSSQEEENATVFINKPEARSNHLDDWEFM